MAVKVGVLLPRQPYDVGAWLADAAAFDAAGADLLWADVAPDPTLDPLVLAAALAAVTFRSLLVVAAPEGAPAPALATVARLGRGRLRLVADAVAVPEEPAFRPVPGVAGTFEHGTDRWRPSPMPDGRAGWRAALLDAAEHGIQGLLLPADPRLLDLLRNPDDPGERHDLRLAQG